jgi:hypothetical protein
MDEYSSEFDGLSKQQLINLREELLEYVDLEDALDYFEELDRRIRESK